MNFTLNKNWQKSSLTNSLSWKLSTIPNTNSLAIESVNISRKLNLLRTKIESWSKISVTKVWLNFWVYNTQHRVMVWVVYSYIYDMNGQRELHTITLIIAKNSPIYDFITGSIQFHLVCQFSYSRRTKLSSLSLVCSSHDMGDSFSTLGFLNSRWDKKLVVYCSTFVRAYVRWVFMFSCRWDRGIFNFCREKVIVVDCYWKMEILYSWLSVKCCE